MELPNSKKPGISDPPPLESTVEVAAGTDTSGEVLPFHTFSQDEILLTDLMTKTIALSGKFDGSPELGVLIAGKTPLTQSSLENLFSSCKVEKKFQNDVYSEYLLDGERGGTGEIKIMAVYPATEDHVRKYRMQKLRFVLETPELYETVTKPYIERKLFSLEVFMQVYKAMLFV